MSTDSIPIVDDAWTPQCGSMEEFFSFDEECADHAAEMPWTWKEEMAIDIAFGIGSSLSFFGSGFIMSVETKTCPHIGLSCLLLSITPSPVHVLSHLQQDNVYGDARSPYVFFPDRFLSMLMRLHEVNGKS